MARRSTGSQRQSRSKAARNVIPGGPGYFRKAVERGAAKGQMQSYGKSINAIVATGAGVDIATIYNVPLSQRREIMEHWNLVTDVLKAKNTSDYGRAVKTLQRFERTHPYTGGANSQELGYDIRDIAQSYLANPDQFNDDNRYPKET